MSNPFVLDFEDMAPNFRVTGPGPDGEGACTIFEGPVTGDFPGATPPISNIRLDQSWGVRFRWETVGPLNYLMAGNWHLTVYLEEMGGGEFNLPGNTMTVPFVSAPHLYTPPPFTFGPGVVDHEGAFRVVTTVDMSGPGSYQGPISAVGEGPILRFYEVG